MSNPAFDRSPRSSTIRPHTLAILAVALLLRLLVLCFVVARFSHNWLYSRGIELGTLAQSLVAGRGLSSPFGGATGPTALLAPGYPAVIALFFRIFGSFTFAAAIAVMVMQLLLSLMTVLSIVHVAERCFGACAANLAGMFWAVSLPLIWMPTIFWETCLSTLLLVGMMALVLRCEQQPGELLWAFMGAYCGLAALVNPALLLALWMLLGWAAWQNRKISRNSPLLGLLVFLLVFIPWPIRNARVLHAFIPLRSTVGFELWVGNRSGATGFLNESLFPLFNKQEHDLYVSRGEVAYMHGKSALAMAYIRAHPGKFLQLSAVRFVRFWIGTGTKDGSAFYAIHAVLTTSLGFIGAWCLVRERRFRLAVLFLMPLIVFPLPYYVTHAEFRYRLVVDPLLTILAAYAVTSGLSQRSYDYTTSNESTALCHPEERRTCLCQVKRGITRQMMEAISTSQSLLLRKVTSLSFVIPRACDFLICACFCTPTRCFFKLHKGRHPERSASQIYRIVGDLWRGVEGPRPCELADALRSFLATSYEGNKKSQPPSLPGFPTSLLPATATYATLRKERRMQLIDQAVLDRKSGEAEGSAVRWISNKCRTHCNVSPRQSTGAHETGS